MTGLPANPSGFTLDSPGFKTWLGQFYDAAKTRAVNVEDYGADPTGATDSGAAIQAAVSAAGTNGGVYFPNGTWLTNRTLTPLAGQTWWGPGTIRRGASAVNQAAVKVTTANVTLRGLNLDGGKGLAQTGAIAVVWVDNTSGVAVTGCHVFNAGTPGIELRMAKRCRVVGNNIHDCTYGINLGQALTDAIMSEDNVIADNTIYAIDVNGIFCTDNLASTASGTVGFRVVGTTIHGNAVDTCGDIGIEIGSGCNISTVGGNTIRSCGDGILVRDNRSATVTGNSVSGMLRCGIVDVGLNNHTEGLVIGNNLVEACQVDGIKVQGAFDVTITGNRCITSTLSGIRLTGDTSYATVSGNTVRANGSHGIQVNSGREVAVVGNTAVENGTVSLGAVDGIYVGGTSHGVTLAANRCLDTRSGSARTQRYGIYVDSGDTHVISLDNHANNNHTGQVQIDAGTTNPSLWTTVSGSRGANAALASLLTSLQARGLISDTTT